MSIAYLPKIVTKGLAAYYDAANPRSYPGTGTIWRDLNGNTNNGTLVNGPTYNSANGGSIVFDAIDDYVDCNNDSSINFASNFTVGAWATRTTNATTNLRLLSKGAGADAATEAGFAFSTSDTSTTFYLNTGTGLARPGVSISISVGVPFYVTGIAENGTMNIYKNGVFVTSTTYTIGTFVGASNLCIGSNTTAAGGRGLYFPGNVYNVHLYNRALSPDEVFQNFNAIRGRFGL